MTAVPGAAEELGPQLHAHPGASAGEVRSRSVYTGTAVFDLLLPGDARSLKAKRAYVRPIVAALRRFEVAVAEVGALDLHGRAEIGVAAVAAEPAQVGALLDSCERLVAGRPEVELLSVRRALRSDDD
jgi:uncharacterized protein YlxP (DUF503 family)